MRETEVITTINGVDIECYVNTEGEMVSVKNICDALQIDYNDEMMRIWESSLLRQLVKPNMAAYTKYGLEHKHSFPLMYAFGYIAVAGGTHNFVPDRKKCYLAFYEFIRRPILKTSTK